jgi:hypothetical protein
MLQLRGGKGGLGTPKSMSAAILVAANLQRLANATTAADTIFCEEQAAVPYAKEMLSS